MYRNCNKTLYPQYTETGYKIPLFCCLCLLDGMYIPIEKRAKCIANCPNIETAKLGEIS